MLTCRWAVLRWKSAGGEGSQNKVAYNWWMGVKVILYLETPLFLRYPEICYPVP